MSIVLKWNRDLVKAGDALGRVGLSKSVLSAIEEFDGSYKGAMVLAGRLKAIAQAAKADGYWSEKVGDGFHKQRQILADLASAPSKPTHPEVET